jgi:hypothetical protein
MFGQQMEFNEMHPMGQCELVIWSDGVTPMMRTKSARPFVPILPSGYGRSQMTPYGPIGMSGLVTPQSLNRDLGYTTNFSIGVLVWLYSNVGSGEYIELFSRGTYQSESSNFGYQLQLRAPNDPNGKTGWAITLSNNTPFLSSCISSDNGTSAGLHLIVATTNGNQKFLYVDGAQANTGGTSTCSVDTVGSSCFLAGDGNYLNRLTVIHSFAIRKALSATEVKRHWDECQGNPLPFLVPRLCGGFTTAQQNPFFFQRQVLGV